MKPMSQPAIYLITGIMSSGKSTVAQLLAEQWERSVHLRGDIFRKMIVHHRAEMTPEVEGTEAENQLRLRYRLAAQAADTYVQAGFTVVVGLWLDTSRLSPEETVAEFRARAESEALVFT